MAAHAIATDHIEHLIIQHPEFAAQWQQMLDNYQKKLWHQLSVQLRDFVELPNVKGVVDLVQLYRSFVADFAGKVNQLNLSHLTVQVSKQLTDPNQRLSFLVEASTHKQAQEAKDALVILKATCAQIKIHLGDLKSADQELEGTGKLVDDLLAADTSVHATYYKAKAQYYKAKEDAQEFYKSGLQYLGYAKVEKVDKEERLQLAVDLGLAALIGEDIYNFGELIQNPVFEVLAGTPHEWLSHVLQAFNTGDIDTWRKLEAQYSAQLNAKPGLVSNKRQLEQKIAILSVMELVFHKNSDDRVVTFDTLAQVSKLPATQVELLVMKALSLGLIKGSIDQTKQIVTISWVQPRVLNLQQVETMQKKLEEWSQTVKQSLLLVENHLTPDLLA